MGCLCPAQLPDRSLTVRVSEDSANKPLPGQADDRMGPLAPRCNDDLRSPYSVRSCPPPKSSVPPCPAHYTIGMCKGVRAEPAGG